MQDISAKMIFVERDETVLILGEKCHKKSPSMLENFKERTDKGELF